LLIYLFIPFIYWVSINKLLTSTIYLTTYYYEARGSIVVQALLCYKPEGSEFETRSGE
jgi:hypothetical protein